jgi:uncharacterized protein YodC (DUF2158 family)
MPKPFDYRFQPPQYSPTIVMLDLFAGKVVTLDHEGLGSPMKVTDVKKNGAVECMWEYEGKRVFAAFDITHLRAYKGDAA